MKTITEYSSIIEVVEAFSDETKNLIYLEQTRWPDGVKCPHCWSEHICRFKDQKRFKCKACSAHFNAKTGSMYEGTKLPLRKWFVAEYLELVGNKGISSYELARQLKITQASAWFLLTRIRASIAKANEGQQDQLEGVIEVDETWVGGKNKNRHTKKKVNYKTQPNEKTLILGMLERGGRMRCKIIPDRSSDVLMPAILSMVKRGSKLMTDQHEGYNSMEYYYDHQRINHNAKVYSEGDITTNRVENFWSILKRGLLGVFHNVSKKHLDKYVQNYVFKYNSRNLKTKEKIDLINRYCEFRLKYKDLKKTA